MPQRHKRGTRERPRFPRVRIMANRVEWPGNVALPPTPIHGICVRSLKLTIQLEQETDGRWIAEVPKLPGVLAYGDTEEKAAQLARALAFRVLADPRSSVQVVPD